MGEPSYSPEFGRRWTLDEADRKQAEPRERTYIAEAKDGTSAPPEYLGPFGAMSDEDAWTHLNDEHPEYRVERLWEIAREVER